MAILFLLITFFICYKIIYCKNPANRLYWYIGSLLCLNDHVQVYGLLNASLIIEIAALLSIYREGKIRLYTKTFPLLLPLCLLFISHIIVGVVDNRLPISQGFFRGVFSFSTSYLMLYTGYILAFQVPYKTIVRTIVFFFVIIGIYTVIEFLSGSNPYYNMIETMYGKENNIWTVMDGQITERGQRCMGTQSNPIYYGLLLASIGLFIVTNVFKDQKNKVLLLLLLAISLIATKSRTPIVAFAIMYLIFLLPTSSFGSTIRVLFLSALFVLLLGHFIPIFDTLINSLIEFASTGDSELQGSSSELRFQQLATSFLYFLNNPIWGNGYYYFSENIFSGKNDSFGGLAGMEGYIFELLIEQGAVQIILILLFWIYCYRCFFKYRALNKNTSYAGMAMSTGFLFFIIATGANGAWLYSMPFIGILLNKSQNTN